VASSGVFRLAFRDLVSLGGLALAFALACSAGACAANDGMRVEVISLERPPEGLGLPPPADYTPCYSGEARAYDTDGDGRPDRVKVTVQGKERCYGEDSNHDGVIDTWDLMDESGNLTRRAHDSNGDGKVDQAWTFDPTRKGCGSFSVDRDGDGKNDFGIPLDVCQPAPASSTVPMALPPTPAPAASARP
jgi:hypothetical protein